MLSAYHIYTIKPSPHPLPILPNMLRGRNRASVLLSVWAATTPSARRAPPAVGSEFWSCDWQLLWNVSSQKSHIGSALPIFLGVPPINGWHVTLRMIDIWGIVSLAFISLLVNTWHTFDGLTPNCQILNFPLLLFRLIWPMKSLAHREPLTGWMFVREWCFLRGYPFMNYPN